MTRPPCLAPFDLVTVSLAGDSLFSATLRPGQGHNLHSEPVTRLAPARRPGHFITLPMSSSYAALSPPLCLSPSGSLN